MLEKLNEKINPSEPKYRSREIIKSSESRKTEIERSNGSIKVMSNSGSVDAINEETYTFEETKSSRSRN